MKFRGKKVRILRIVMGWHRYEIMMRGLDCHLREIRGCGSLNRFFIIIDYKFLEGKT